MLKKLKMKFKTLIKYFYIRIFAINNILAQIIELKDIYLLNTYALKANKAKNEFVKYGAKCFSQSDEDGITLEIVNRLKLDKNSFFAEFGVGDGLENNTSILAALRWKGLWVGNDNLKIPNQILEPQINYIKTWITKDNISDVCNEYLNKNKINNFDLISIDLDGNDFYLVEELFRNKINPKVFIVEYNSHFPPPIEFIIKYNENHVYNGDAYFGASLQSYNNLFNDNGYFLVCCNLFTGANAFFIKDEYKKLFPELPQNINDIYIRPNFHLPKNFGYKHTLETYKAILKDDKNG